VRLTGGEPLARPGIVDLVRRVRGIPGLRDLALSTNGTLLAEHASDLRAAGLMRVNVSLDSLRAAVFRAVSGRNDLGRVTAGIRAARDAGLTPLKLNVVVMRGVNDDELPAIVEFAARHDAQARFIEYMRSDSANGGTRRTCSAPRSSSACVAPRRRTAPPSLRGGRELLCIGRRRRGGVISPVSCRFCDLCNRLRVTADGRLRPCLTSEGEVDLRSALRPRPDASAIGAAFAPRPQVGRPPAPTGSMPAPVRERRTRDGGDRRLSDAALTAASMTPPWTFVPVRSPRR